MTTHTSQVVNCSRPIGEESFHYLMIVAVKT